MEKSRIVIASCLLPVVLAGCAGGGGGSSSTPSSPPAPPPVVTSPGVSVSATYGPGMVAGSRVLTSTPQTDATSTLTTTGIIGRSGAVSTVTSATITSDNASGSGGRTLTINQTVSNNANSFVASSTAPNNITANTATQPLGGGAATNYLYTTFGSWGDCTPPSCGSASETGVAGWYAYGQETPLTAIPNGGSASYTGTLNGNYIDGTATAYAVRADLTATAYFDGNTPSHAARSVDFATNNSNILPIAPGGGLGTPVLDSNLNMAGTLTIGPGTNQFSGPVMDVGGRTGTATGRFYGPTANEIGGVYNLTNGTQTNIGSFVAK